MSFRIKAGETTADELKIPFTVVSVVNLQSRMEDMEDDLVIEVSKNGGAFAAGLGTVTEISDGCYVYQLHTSEVASAGCVIIRTSGTRTTDASVSEVREIAVQVYPDDTVNANVVSTGNNVITGASLAASAVDDIVAGVFAQLIEDGAEDTISMLQAMRGILAYACGKASGWDTGLHVYRSADDVKNRITATVGSTGRTAVSLDLD